LFLIARWIRRSFKSKFIAVGVPKLPEVKVAVRAIISMRDAGDTSSIGTERFPNQASVYFHFGLFVRQILRLICLFACIAQLMISIEVKPDTPIESEFIQQSIAYAEQIRGEYQTIVGHVRDWQVPQPVACVSIYFALVMLWMLLNNNRQYLVIRFPTSLVITSLLTSLVWLGVAGLGPFADQNFGIVYATTYVLLWLVMSRMHRDLQKAKSYKRRRLFLGPVSDAVSQAVRSFLESVQHDLACRLPELTTAALSERITRGARNIEEGDAFVTRFFGRYMRIAKVASERCTTASMRFLTINRFTERGSCWPTYSAFRDPNVPVWDETMFPIDAPTGFVNRRDSKILPSLWNPVVYCPPTEQRAQTYYETEYYTEWDSSSKTSVSRTRQVQRTRYETVTCSVCNGAGRLEYERYLVTTWATTRPTVVSPHMQMPELVENAEEVLYYQLPIIDEGKMHSSTSRVVDAATMLRGQMEKAGKHLVELAPTLSKLVEKCTGDAYVYRADFIVGGLHAMNIRFSFLRSRTGWFFGNRPEFHFPKLPLGWATVGTWLFLPPIAITIWAIAIALMLGIVTFVYHGASINSTL